MTVEIKVLGTGCPRCKQLAGLVDDVTGDIGAEGITFEKVENISEIMKYGVLAVPGLVINGEVKSVGNVPSRADLVGWIQAAKEE